MYWDESGGDDIGGIDQSIFIFEQSLSSCKFDLEL